MLNLFLFKISNNLEYMVNVASHTLLESFSKIDSKYLPEK